MPTRAMNFTAAASAGTLALKPVDPAAWGNAPSAPPVADGSGLPDASDQGSSIGVGGSAATLRAY